jgi:hypothetical protein
MYSIYIYQRYVFIKSGPPADLEKIANVLEETLERVQLSPHLGATGHQAIECPLRVDPTSLVSNKSANVWCSPVDQRVSERAGPGHG